jgi:hypothetical protein
MSPADFDFVRRVIATSRSGPGFPNDLEHRIDGSVRCRVLQA